MTNKNNNDISFADRLNAFWQYCIPHHLLSRLMGKLTHSRNKLVKLTYMKFIIKFFGVNMDEAQEQDLNQYEHFNAFFTRALKPEARPIVDNPAKLASPVDGRISQMGPINKDRLFQAKGHEYSLGALLGAEDKWAKQFVEGEFATIYLSPKDYHRIHMPCDARLKEMRHIPGKLFSVNPATTRAIPGLFARNERLVCLFNTPVGPMAMILVGALFVASIETTWQGVITPPTHADMQVTQYAEGMLEVALKKGEEMGRFNMGSTVILLFRKDKMQWLEGLEAGSAVNMGQEIGTIPA
ncbi:MAG: archaetidylserine decarboxylase [Gammaproteobacteria bacterium]|nr:archaetidylserine decarboxylase [Gammaproteobacteria bacterium]MDH5651068.1 archaetidylserine decarboxylase [Gammaproteobacteria bacterium]